MSNAACSVLYKHHLTPWWVSLHRGVVISVKLGINLAEYWTIPKREHTLDTFLGGSIYFRALTLLGDGFTPSFEDTKPKNSI